MAGQNCEFRGVDQSLAGFDLHTQHNQTPYFSVWFGKDPRFSYSQDDMQGSRAFFEEVLEALQMGQSTAIYIIKFHDEVNKKGKIDNQTPVIGSFTFRLFDNSGIARGDAWHNGQPMQPVAVNPGTELMNKFQQRMMDRMLQQLDAADQAAISGPGGDFDAKQQFMLEIANSPVGEALIGMIRDILPIKKRPMAQPQQQQHAGMAGIDDDSILALVERLRKKDKDFDKHLEMLADLAEESPMIYKRAIAKLKDIYE